MPPAQAEKRSAYDSVRTRMLGPSGVGGLAGDVHGGEVRVRVWDRVRVLLGFGVAVVCCWWGEGLWFGLSIVGRGRARVPGQLIRTLYMHMCQYAYPCPCFCGCTA